jgi:endonuclease III
MKKKPNLQGARKKIIDRFVSAGSIKPGDTAMPLANLCTTFCAVDDLARMPIAQARLKTAIPRMVRAFLEFDADAARAQAAEARLAAAMVDLNELRVTPAIEVAAILGSRYPFAEHRSSLLHRTLQSIYERENQMSLASLQSMKKTEVRNYLRTLTGITPYVEATMALECFDVAACPVDTKLTLWLVSRGVLDEACTPLEAQQTLEREIPAKKMHSFYIGSRKELEDWAPKVWPPVAKVPSPVLAPPVVSAPAAAPVAGKPAKARAVKPKPITVKKAAVKK